MASNFAPQHKLLPSVVRQSTEPTCSSSIIATFHEQLPIRNVLPASRNLHFSRIQTHSVEELGKRQQRCRSKRPTVLSIKRESARAQRSQHLQRIALVVREGDSLSQYAWDGERLLTVKVEGENTSRAVWAVNWAVVVTKFLQFLRRVCIPEDVRPNYMAYMRWRFVHRMLSSILHVQSTQAMLRAIGVGAQRAFPSAAALNWVLKDGLGRFGKLVYTACLGQTFDSDIKRVRFTTSMLFSISLGLEMLTPFFPKYFLLMATWANVGKSISFAAYVSTNSAILKSFALFDNLADIAAKGQVQAVVADNLGLVIAVAINRIYKYIPSLESTLPILIFPFISTFELFAIFKEIQSVHLLTLNKVRLEIIAYTWLCKGTVPSAEEVSKFESRFLLFGAGQNFMNLKMGALASTFMKRNELTALLELQRGQCYLLLPDLEHYPSWSNLSNCSKVGLHLWLHEEASPTDIIKGVLQATLIQTGLKPDGNLHLEVSRLLKAQNPIEAVQHLFDDETNAASRERSLGGSVKEFMVWVKESGQFVKEHIGPLLAEMQKGGWLVNHILLNPHERCTYNIPDT